MVSIYHFLLDEDEQRLVRKIRGTADKRELMPLVKELGALMERRQAPELLKRYGFTRIELLASTEHSGPEPFDLVAWKGDKAFYINSKIMAKRTSTFNISSSNHETIEFLARGDQDIGFGYLLMKVSDDDDGDGTAFLFLTVDSN